MVGFASKVRFKLLTSTPYYAQVNGQVETANKTLIGLIKNHVGKHPRNWHKTLNQMLWACRNSPKESTNTTPFQLVYRHDAVLPLEVHLQSVRVQIQAQIPNEFYWGMRFHELVELDDERLVALDVLMRKKERVVKAYNKKVKPETFNLGDLVWKVILPLDKKDITLGKPSPNMDGPFRILQTYMNNAYEVEELTPEGRILRINDKYLEQYRPIL